MNILITGGTGLIGQAIMNHPLFAEDEFIVLTRRKSRAEKHVPAGTRIIETLKELDTGATIDGVINLAGEQIVGKRWSENRKRAIRESRIDLTHRLVSFIDTLDQKPKVLISGSAIGFYGNTADQEVNENSPNGNDFGATLCSEWEREALNASELGTRVCIIRTGLVLTAKGGMLQQLLLPFKLGLGARLGNGNQWMSWIHMEDEIAAIHYLIHNHNCSGAYNLTAPAPVTNRQFTRQLASALSRPSFLFAPAAVLQLLLGEAAELLLGGQQVLPQKLQDEGYQFRFPELTEALTDILKH